MCDADTSQQFALGYIPLGGTTTTTTTRTSWFVRGRMDGWGWHVCCWEGFALRLRLSQVYFRHKPLARAAQEGRASEGKKKASKSLLSIAKRQIGWHVTRGIHQGRLAACAQMRS